MELFEMKQELGFLSEVLEAQDSPTQRDKDKDELYNFKILFLFSSKKINFDTIFIFTKQKYHNCNLRIFEVVV